MSARAGCPLFVASVLLLLSGSASARAIRVPWDAPTIAAGIGLAIGPSDTVLVDPGVYSEHDIAVSLGITVAGATGHPEDVVVDAAGLGRVFRITAQQTRPNLDAMTIRNGSANNGGGVLADNEPGVNFSRCRFENNHAAASGGGLMLIPTDCVLTDCTFEGNSAARGAAIYLQHSGVTALSGCRFLHNSAAVDGGGIHSDFSTPVLDNCLLAKNSALHGAGIQVDGFSILRVRASTFAYDSAPNGAGIYVAATQGVNLQTSIFAFNTGPAVSCADVPPFVSCTDVFGNAGGDWVGCLSGLDGVSGNFSEDPSFCDAANDDFHLTECSRCTAGAACVARIGALDGGCAPLGICLKTTPVGLIVTADGVSHPSPYDPHWSVGTSHIVGTPTGQVPHGDTRYDFENWSDGGAQEHEVTDSRQVLTASFDSLFALTTTVTPAGHGAVVPGSGWFTPGTSLQLHVQADSGWALREWTGRGDLSYEGPGPIASVILNTPIFEQAALQPAQPVTVSSNPPGAHVTLGGVSYTTPVTLYWGEDQALPVSADSIQTVSPGTRFRYLSWSDGGPRSHLVIVGHQPIQLELACAFERELSFEANPNADFIPGNSWLPPGATVAIRAVAHEGFRLMSWTGTGDGSYTGPDNPTTVTMNAPIHEAAALEQSGHGYELRVSGSATDPNVNVGEPSSDPRSLYLWLSCAESGISAFEADVISSMFVAGFNPSAGVLNAGGAGNLLLAIAACPTGDSLNRLLGSWTVLDVSGGSFCLGPSVHDGIIGAVDCTSPTPTFWADPVVVGFSSTAAPPCSVGTNGCTAGPVAIDMSGFAATVGDHMVRLTWSTSFEAHNLGFHVQRRALGEAFRQITTDLVTGTNGAYVYEDHDVVGDRTYEYGVVDVDSSGREIFHGPISVTTPKWAPIRTGIAALQPNPFVDRVTVRFGLTRPSRATVSVYDVTGRLVRRLVDGMMAPGNHDVEWSGIDANARAVAAGVYFVRFSAPDRTETKKIVRLGHP